MMAAEPGSSGAGMTQPKADQPRVDTSSLQRKEAPPSLTYRQEGIKNYTGRSQRDYSRR
jgi:hypothetical protein